MEGTDDMSTLRIFVSSPGDVGEERALVEAVIRRLQGLFAQRVRLEPIFWEHEPLRATQSFQEQIRLPSETDIFICILWSRLGTRLPRSITRPDGTPYASGTEFEFEDAVNAYQKTKTPDLLVYRKMATATTDLTSEEAVLDKLAQKKALDAFLEKWFRDDDGSFKAAFHPFNDPAEFEERLEQHLHKLIEERLPQTPAGSWTLPEPMWKGSPFRGLRLFDREHAPIFFGRTRAVSEMLERLRRQAAAKRAFVLVVGMSGGGKSSLVRAGVLPRLMQPGVIEGIGLWRIAALRPGEEKQGDLLDALAGALLRDDGVPELAASGATQDELARLLRETPQGVTPLIRMTLAQISSALAQSEHLLQPPEARLVLLVDQLEEIFTRESIMQEQRIAFIGALSALAHGGAVWVIATLRSDFYARCTDLPELMALKEGHGQYDLQPPTPPEISQMIREPTRMAGLRFVEDPDSGERLDDTLRDAAVQHPQSLPLLEFTLEELYQARSGDGVLTHAAYRAMGGLEGAIGARAEEVFQELDQAAQKALPAVMSALVSLGSEEAIDHEQVGFLRQWAPLEQLAETPGGKRLADRFISARLLVAEQGSEGSPVVSVAHEALLRYWPRLNAWLDENHVFLRARARATAAAARWQEEERNDDFLLPDGKPLKEAETLLRRRSELNRETIEFIECSINASRRKRRRKIIGVSVAALVVLISGFGYWDGFYREQITYYENFITRWGIPEGVMEISRTEASYRADVLKFTRQGRFGRVNRIDVVNGYDQCPTISTIMPLTRLIAFRKLEELVSDPPIICTFIFEYKESGNISSVKMLFNDDRPPELLVYHSIDNVVYSEKNRPVKGTQSGVVSARLIYIGQGPLAGLVREARFVDRDGNAQPDEGGAFGSRLEYNSQGLPIEKTVLDADGNAYLLPDIGIARVSLSYSPRNRIERIKFIGQDTSPATLKGSALVGVSSAQFSYDRRGNLFEQKYFDIEGRLTAVNLQGMNIAKLQLKYDGHGGINEAVFSDAKGQLSGMATASGLETFKYDDRGNPIEHSYFDGGSIRWTKTYGDRGQLVETREWLAEPGKVGYASVSKFYDSNGRVIEEAYFDRKNQPTLNRENACARIAVKYDERGNMIEVICSDEDGKQKRGIAGNARLTAKYDERGNRIEEAYFDEKGEPVRHNKKGFARTTAKYDKHGNQVEEAYFDEESNPTLNKNGYARVTVEYDEQGKAIAMAYYDVNGQRIEGNVLVVIDTILPDGQAARLGLQPGDRVIRFADEPIRSRLDLIGLTDLAVAGARELVIERGGAPFRFQVAPGKIGVEVKDVIEKSEGSTSGED